jgi:hypothetical protein
MRWFTHLPVLPFRFACSSISLLAVRAESRRSSKRSQVGRFVLAGHRQRSWFSGRADVCRWVRRQCVGSDRALGAHAFGRLVTAGTPERGSAHDVERRPPTPRIGLCADMATLAVGVNRMRLTAAIGLGLCLSMSCGMVAVLANDGRRAGLLRPRPGSRPLPEIDGRNDSEFRELLRLLHRPQGELVGDLLADSDEAGHQFQ